MEKITTPSGQKSTVAPPKQKRVRDFVLGFFGWFIVNKIYHEIFLITPFSHRYLLLNLVPFIIPIVLFAMKKNWFGIGSVSAIATIPLSYLPLFAYYYFIGD
jgi:hypothetical protein